MSVKSRIQHGFHKAASSYDTHAYLQREVAQGLFKESRNRFPARAKLLDAGCGTGYFHELARSHGYKWAIYQLDLAYGMCQLAENYSAPPAYGGNYTINGDIEMLPFADNSFDGIFSSLAIQWTNSATALKHFYAALASGGIMTIATLGPGSLQELSAAFAAQDTLPHIHPFVPLDTLTQQLTDTGFDIVECRKETKTLFYPDAMALMHSLKGIGASYKATRPGQRYNREYFARLDSYYRTHFGQEQGLPASWEILTLIAAKP